MTPRLLQFMLPALACATALAQPAPPAAPAAPRPIEFKTVAEALAALKARDGNGTVVTQADGWTTINEPMAAAQWSFTPGGHEAHPAVVRRIIQRGAGGAVSVDTALLCEAAAEPCQRLRSEFETMNGRITQAVKARGRATPPQTPPPTAPQ